MFDEEFECWFECGTNRKHIQHKRTKQMVATVHLNSAEGFALFDALRKGVRVGGGKLFDVDTGEYLR
jgi:hypothetical protein